MSYARAANLNVWFREGIYYLFPIDGLDLSAGVWEAADGEEESS
jgi:hypothetical protein